MNPEEVYREYSTVFDYFSDERFSPSNKYFIDHVAKLIRAGLKVCDVGGGTGYFSQKLLDLQPNLNLLFIEPSESMISQARSRMGENCAYLKQTFDQAVPTLEKQDMFVFQRSFYHLRGNLESYKELIKKIYELTNENGFVCIQDVPHLYDLDALKRHIYEKHLELGLSVETFQEKWPTLEKVLKDFNERVARGEYFKISSDALVVFFIFAGFSLFHFSSDHNAFFFYKSSTPLAAAERL